MKYLLFFLSIILSFNIYAETPTPTFTPTITPTPVYYEVKAVGMIPADLTIFKMRLYYVDNTIIAHTRDYLVEWVDSVGNTYSIVDLMRTVSYIQEADYFGDTIPADIYNKYFK